MARTATYGGVVSRVEPGAARRAGLTVGDIVQAVDNTPLRDVIDWWWLTDEPYVTLDVRRGDERVDIEVEREPGEPLGVGFTETLFDGIRECENACAFCFVSALPAGLRPALYVRDDDFRLSFLAGNFVTLTNLDGGDVDRIIEQRLSPLHVSVHAIDPDVRTQLICPTGEDSALEILDELLAEGIEVHVQIVLVPGVNDGPILDETLEYLAEREGILSVGCVPMGYTEHQQRWRSSYSADSAAAVLALVHRWQARMRGEVERGWVYAADEFYLMAREPLPSPEAYDGFPQYENGIGMASAFLAEFTPTSPHVAPATVVTGALFAPVLRHALVAAGWTAVHVLPVHNALFGGNVGVTGLLGGRDIASAIRADGARGTYYLPDVVVNSDGLLLDDVPAADLSALTGADVRFIGSDAGSLVEALSSGEAALR